MPSPPPSQNTSSSQQQNAFHSYPQKFAKTRQKASRLASAFVELQRHGPRSVVGIVVDTSFHLTQGYVVCQLQKGIVRVYSVPFGTVVNRMRIYCRIIGAQSTNHAYVFDGYAPNLSSLGPSGSVLVTLPNLAAASVCTTTVGAVPSITGLTGAVGYYWHLFCYFPIVVSSPITVMQMVQSGGTNTLTLDYTPGGFVRFHSQDGHGYITTQPISAHNVHWIQIQPGLAGQELLVDGVATYTGLLSPTDEPTFTGGTAVYTLSFLSNTDGTGSSSVASWVSKMAFGASDNGISVIPLSTGTTMPTDDTLIPLLTGTGASQAQTVVLYLCTDTPGSPTLASSGSASTVSLTLTTATSLITTGPY